MTKNKQPNLDIFDFGEDEDDPMNQWRGMPEFNQPPNGAMRQIIVSFDTQEGVDKFAKLIGQDLTPKTKSLWFPPRPTNKVVDLFYFDERPDAE